MKTHVVKVHTTYFDAIYRGQKTFEIRKNDRSYTPGDVLILRGWNPGKNEFTSQIMAARVDYIASPKTDPILIDMLYENHVVMSISRMDLPHIAWDVIHGLIENSN